MYVNWWRCWHRRRHHCRSWSRCRPQGPFAPHVVVRRSSRRAADCHPPVRVALGMRLEWELVLLPPPFGLLKSPPLEFLAGGGASSGVSARGRQWRESGGRLRCRVSPAAAEAAAAVAIALRCVPRRRCLGCCPRCYHRRALFSRLTSPAARQVAPARRRRAGGTVGIMAPLATLSV